MFCLRNKSFSRISRKWRLHGNKSIETASMKTRILVKTSLSHTIDLHVEFIIIDAAIIVETCIPDTEDTLFCTQRSH